MDQQHLDELERINQGSYYTPSHIVELVYRLISHHISLSELNFLNLLDTSCGYGSFFDTHISFLQRLGSDIDLLAIQQAKMNFPFVRFFCQNSLINCCRENYGLLPDDNLLIVGNPPYNDTTSLVNKKVKKEIFEVCPQVKSRDLGISFLLSYALLEADYICVLHPLSYLIKSANLRALAPFCKKYRLVENLVISSQDFSETSKTSAFPILIALYQKNEQGMSENYIQQIEFKTRSGQRFRLSEFDWINRFVSKYPNQKSVPAEKAIAKFWTLRDINALKRSQTFMEKTVTNTIFVTEEMLDYYCYIDGFKRFINHIPYYLGNCEIMIDAVEFDNYREYFRSLSALSHPFLQDKIPILYDKETCLQKLDFYFRRLWGTHWL